LPGDLCIRVLGYFDLKEYQAIQDAQGFYITRVKTTTCLFLKPLRLISSAHFNETEGKIQNFHSYWEKISCFSCLA
ncbi:hypothetical protein AAK913_14845, partial [Enterococcus faecium]|uniref:hypothetical protein n=1 Tax=Enterococcus faecium TaxID=1352 RepID=UPI003511E923